MKGITISSSLNPSNNRKGVFPDFAGPQSKDKDDALIKELTLAGIDIFQSKMLSDRNSEVKTSVMGLCSLWIFERFWYYWAAKGPGIPPSYAWELYKKNGQAVRVGGSCGYPSPAYYNGFAVGLYHVDTPEGLKDLADTIKRVEAEAREE